MSKPRYYYPDKEQQRKTSPLMVVLTAIIFVPIMIVGFAVLGFFSWVAIPSPELDATHSLNRFGCFIVLGGFIGFVLSIFLLFMMFRRRKAD